ncbi:MAG TPA: helix-turn-helix domain-containing protein [Pseudonocardiaceae bacterium]|nr:helix-turn-helix domain-containing protein [Pseudonocardiaceae bacterium]
MPGRGPPVLDFLAVGGWFYGAVVQSVVRLADGGEFAVDSVTCDDDHTRWSAAQVEPGCELVLVRHGRFRRRALGVEQDVDSTLAYLSPAGQEEHFAHPAGGDMCTLVTLGNSWWDWVGEPRQSTVYVDARVDLAHRRVLAAARDGDVDFGVAEGLVGLVAAAARVPRAAPKGELVALAREAIAADAAEGLFGLAELLGVSAYRLSRAFSAEVGVSVTRYRNRVRVGRALDRLAEGEQDLAGLAADLGFADQGHLCRTVRQHLGTTPTAVRRVLAPSRGGRQP